MSDNCVWLDSVRVVKRALESQSLRVIAARTKVGVHRLLVLRRHPERARLFELRRLELAGMIVLRVYLPE